jgi:hypothetical protein
VGNYLHLFLEKTMTRLSKWDKESIARAIINDVPKVDKEKRRADIQMALVKAMSPECRKIYGRTPDALRTLHLGDLTYNGMGWGTRDVVVGDVPKANVDAILEPYQKEDSKRAEVGRNLKAAIMACSSVKQLNERLPEFKNYYPSADKPVTTLPALANVVADLTKLGWPDGVKK